MMPKRTFLNRFRFALLGVAVVLWLGCGGKSNLPALVPVTGKVTLDKKPLAEVAVVFMPIENTRGQGGQALTGPDGSYQLKSRDGRGPGVPVGLYRVTVSPGTMPTGPDGGAVSAGGIMVPSIYISTTQTPLSAKVPEEGGVFDYHLTSSR